MSALYSSHHRCERRGGRFIRSFLLGQERRRSKKIPVFFRMEMFFWRRSSCRIVYRKQSLLHFVQGPTYLRKVTLAKVCTFCRGVRMSQHDRISDQ